MWFLGKMRYERYAKVPFSLGPMGGVCEQFRSVNISPPFNHHLKALLLKMSQDFC